MEHDVVNHPSHYCREGGMESIDEMVLVFGKEAVKNFCICNIWKYRYRAADKNGEEDLKKSDWYMRKYKELCDLDAKVITDLPYAPSKPIPWVDTPTTPWVDDWWKQPNPATPIVTYCNNND